MAEDVPGAVVKVVELVGSSETSFSDAVRNAVRVASRTIRDIQGVEVISSTADVDASGELNLYKVNCKVAFLVEASRDEDLSDMARQAPEEEPPVATGGPDVEQ